MTPRFIAFIPFTLAFEVERNRDGSVKVERDPDDPGGTTKFGIDQRSHPKVDIARLTEEQAMDIYYSEWQRWPCDELPAPFGELLFDIKVNGGPVEQWLQSGLVVKVDNYIGPKTIAAAKRLSIEGAENAVEFICDSRDARYRRLARRRQFAKYLKGWLRRSAELRKLSLRMLTKAEGSSPTLAFSL